MLAKHLRLRKNQDYQRVYRQGLAGWNQDFKIIARPNGLLHNRYGFTLSGKFGKAYERNRMRRRLHEIVRLNQDKFLPGYDYVIIPRQSSKGKSHRALKKSFFHCLGRWERKTKKKREDRSKG